MPVKGSDMDRDTRNMLVTMGGVVVGLVVMLYGVSLTAGESLTVFTILGGGIIVVAIGVLTAWEMVGEADHEGEADAHAE
jgi:hypothetical protein